MIFIRYSCYTQPVQFLRVYSFFIIISLILHVLVIFFTFPKPKPPKRIVMAEPGTGNDILKVRTIPSSQMLMKPIEEIPKPKQQQSQTAPPPPPEGKQLGLESLRLEPPTRKKRERNSRMRVKQLSQALERGLPLTQVRTRDAVNNYIQQSQLKRQKIIEYQSHQQTKNLLQQSNLNFHFIPPQGLKETEFNELNKVLFSFKRRMFISYLNSFITQYNQISLERPLLKNAMQSENHTLTGKITFDREGNIVKINILKSTHNDDIHRLFEETLTGIGSLPNPPKMLIEDREQFVIYYQLKVN